MQQEYLQNQIDRSNIAAAREQVLFDISEVELKRAEALAEIEIQKQRELAKIQIEGMKKQYGLDN